MDAADLLRTARRLTDTTQAELARRAGISASLLNRYENRRVDPTVDQLLRLLEQLGYDVHLRALDDHMSDRLGQLIDDYPTLPTPGPDDAGVHDGTTGRQLTADESLRRLPWRPS